MNTFTHLHKNNSVFCTICSSFNFFVLCYFTLVLFPKTSGEKNRLFCSFAFVNTTCMRILFTIYVSCRAQTIIFFSFYFFFIFLFFSFLLTNTHSLALSFTCIFFRPLQRVSYKHFVYFFYIHLLLLLFFFMSRKRKKSLQFQCGFFLNFSFIIISVLFVVLYLVLFFVST